MLNQGATAVHVEHLRSPTNTENGQSRSDGGTQHQIFGVVTPGVGLFCCLEWLLAVASGFNIPATTEHDAIQARDHAGCCLGIKTLGWQEHNGAPCSLDTLEIVAWNHRKFARPHTGGAWLAICRDAD
jgi:hypothetical protein